MAKLTPVPVYLPAMPMWALVGGNVCGSFVLSAAAIHAGVSPLWTTLVGVPLAVWTSRQWSRRRHHDITAKACPVCGKPPAMVLEEDGNRVHVRVWCRTRPVCPVVGGVEVKATLDPDVGQPRADTLRLVCQRAADGWSGDDMQTILRRQARD